MRMAECDSGDSLTNPHTSRQWSFPLLFDLSPELMPTPAYLGVTEMTRRYHSALGGAPITAQSRIPLKTDV